MGEILKYQGNPSIYLEEPYIIDSIYDFKAAKEDAMILDQF